MQSSGGRSCAECGTKLFAAFSPTCERVMNRVISTDSLSTSSRACRPSFPRIGSGTTTRSRLTTASIGHRPSRHVPRRRTGVRRVHARTSMSSLLQSSSERSELAVLRLPAKSTVPPDQDLQRLLPSARHRVPTRHSTQRFTVTRHSGGGEPGAEATRLLGRGHAVPGFARPTPGGGVSERRGAHRVHDGADPRSTRGGSGSRCRGPAGETGRVGQPSCASAPWPLHRVAFAAIGCPTGYSFGLDVSAAERVGLAPAPGSSDRTRRQLPARAAARGGRHDDAPGR